MTTVPKNAMLPGRNMTVTCPCGATVAQHVSPGKNPAYTCQSCRTVAAGTFWKVLDATGGIEAWTQVQAELTVARDGWPKLDVRTWQPVAADVVKCGNRTDVPKKQRRHPWLDAGEGTIHKDDGSYAQMTVYICGRCGTTKYTTMEAE